MHRHAVETLRLIVDDDVAEFDDPRATRRLAAVASLPRMPQWRPGEWHRFAVGVRRRPARSLSDVRAPSRAAVTCPSHLRGARSAAIVGEEPRALASAPRRMLGGGGTGPRPITLQSIHVRVARGMGAVRSEPRRKRSQERSGSVFPDGTPARGPHAERPAGWRGPSGWPPHPSGGGPPQRDDGLPILGPAPTEGVAPISRRKPRGRYKFLQCKSLHAETGDASNLVRWTIGTPPIRRGHPVLSATQGARGHC